MILVRRKGLTALLLVTLSCILFTGIRGYVVVGDVALTDIDSKFFAENLLYITMIVCIVVVFSYGTLMARSRSLIKEIDKIIELTQVGSTTVEDSLKKIGLIGKKIFKFLLIVGISASHFHSFVTGKCVCNINMK